MRTKTNTQAVLELMDKFTPAQYGISSPSEIELIRDILELDGRNDLELTDIRDMAVTLYAQSAQADEKNGVQAVMAKMNAMTAVTAVVDQELCERTEPGRRITTHIGSHDPYAVATLDGTQFMRAAGQPELSGDPADARLFRTPDQALGMAAHAAARYKQPMTVVRIETCRTVFPIRDMPAEQNKIEKGGFNDDVEDS